MMSATPPSSGMRSSRRRASKKNIREEEAKDMSLRRRAFLYQFPDITELRQCALGVPKCKIGAATFPGHSHIVAATKIFPRQQIQQFSDLRTIKWCVCPSQLRLT